MRGRVFLVPPIFWCFPGGAPPAEHFSTRRDKAVELKKIVRPTLLHALFPAARAEILRLLFTNPKQELYVRELARLSFLSLHTVQDELTNLYTAKLLLSRSNGYHRFYHANPRHPLYTTLRRLVIKTAPLAKPVSRRRRRAAGSR
jgi:hypothetical protein